MEVKLTADQESFIHRVIETGKYRSVDEVVDSALKSLRQQEGIPPDLTRSQLAGQRIRELRKGLSLDGISIRELIEEGRE